MTNSGSKKGGKNPPKTKIHAQKCKKGAVAFPTLFYSERKEQITLSQKARNTKNSSRKENLTKEVKLKLVWLYHIEDLYEYDPLRLLGHLQTCGEHAPMCWKSNMLEHSINKVCWST